MRQMDRRTFLLSTGRWLVLAGLAPALSGCGRALRWSDSQGSFADDSLTVTTVAGAGTTTSTSVEAGGSTTTSAATTTTEGTPGLGLHRRPPAPRRLPTWPSSGATPRPERARRGGPAGRHGALRQAAGPRWWSSPTSSPAGLPSTRSHQPHRRRRDRPHVLRGRSGPGHGARLPHQQPPRRLPGSGADPGHAEAGGTLKYLSNRNFETVDIPEGEALPPGRW